MKNKEDYIKHILQSKSFGKSDTLRSLLEYLAKKTFAGENIKEFTIAEEFFRKSDDSSSVRVYIHNLRKKLQEYYKEDGASDTYQLSIPKGQYYVEIKEKQKTKKSRKKLWYWIILILFKITLLTSLFLYRKYQPKTWAWNTSVWEGVMVKNQKTLIVLGDHYFLAGKTPTGREGVIRDYKINNEADLNQFVLDNPEFRDSIKESGFTYQTKQASACLFRVMQAFKETENIEIKLSSELEFDDLKKNNILYFGSFKSFYKLEEVFAEDIFSFDILINTLYYPMSEKDSVLQYKTGRIESRTNDYPLVVKIKGPYEHYIMAFACINDPANEASLDFLLDKDKVAEFEKKINLNRENHCFKAVFNVNSLGRTDMGIELLNAEKISINE